jgi:hypothetical protein
MAHSRRPRPTGIGVLAVVLFALALIAACTSAGPEHPAAAPAPHPAAAASPDTGATTPGATAPAPPKEAKCSYRPSTAALPTWARAGFSPPYNDSKYVTSNSGNMVGVLFGDPLRAGTPGPTQRQNKILWVARDSTVGPMTIDAELVGSTELVHLGQVPIGPSYVDVPNAGCWHLTLHLATGDDSVDIVYGKG